MPAQIAHCLAAEDALLIADPLLAESWGIGFGWGAGSVGRHPLESPADWFRFGAQGPDIFYHNQRTMPSGLHYGALAHRKNYGLIVEGSLAALIEGGIGTDSAEAAWLLGFATHAALDRAAHPFIVYFSGWGSPSKPESASLRGCHPFLERLLDLALLGEFRGLPVSAIDLEELLPLGSRPAPRVERIDLSIARLLAQGLRTAYPRATNADVLLERRVANAIIDACYFFRVTNPARINSPGRGMLSHFDDRAKIRAVSLLHPEELPAGLDPANRAGQAWEHPAGDGRHYRASFFDLYREGLRMAAETLSLTLAAIRAGSIDAGFASSVGNGGLSVADPDGIPVPPRLSQPLPLSAFMEAEFAKRLEQARNLPTP